MINFVSCLGEQRIALACILLTGLAVAVRPVSAQSTAEETRQRLGKEYRLVELVVGGDEVRLPEQPTITLKLASETVLGGKATSTFTLPASILTTRAISSGRSPVLPQH
jgi:hypothetical protein